MDETLIEILLETVMDDDGSTLYLNDGLEVYADGSDFSGLIIGPYDKTIA